MVSNAMTRRAFITQTTLGGATGVSVLSGINRFPFVNLADDIVPKISKGHRWFFFEKGER